MTETNPPAKLLIVRFSSFGDIVQAMGVPAGFLARYPGAEVHWLVREDFAALLNDHPCIRQTHAFSRREGAWGLVRRAWRMGRSGYTHVYDAHNNLRSALFTLFFSLSAALDRNAVWPLFRRRPKNRLRRWLLFRWRIQLLPRPFKGIRSYLEPLENWGVPQTAASPPQCHFPPAATQAIAPALAEWGPFIALVPSAAWEMKRWPVAHWKRLIELLPEHRFIVFGGPEDGFCEELRLTAPDRVLNLAGRCSLAASAAALAGARLVISGDTGLLHVADQTGVPTLALIGPTAFGYPTHATSKVLELDLPCKPCSKDGRGRCRNAVYQRCLVELLPERVAEAVRVAVRESAGLP